MKQCFKCTEWKPKDEFYRHKAMTDGVIGKCKDCTKADMRRDRLTKPRVREYDRERSKLPHRAELRKRVTKEWRAKNPERAKAQRTLARAVRSGDVKKPSRCELCGLPDMRIEAHHHDYSYPLIVVWMCKPCHATADKLRRIQERLVSQLPF